MGELRRRIRIVAGSREVRGTLEDDFHHFRVALRHDGKFIVDTACEPIRYPFSLCPAAGEQLQVLIGQPLDASVLTLTNYTDRLQQCTHQLDLACLAAATAFQEKSWKTYDIRVDDPEDGDPRPAVLWMDGKKVLDWQFAADRIISSDEFSGVDLRGGFRKFLYAAPLSDERIEQATVLRRGIFISKGRSSEAWSGSPSHMGGCYVLQPERFDQANPVNNSRRDFSGDPEKLTMEDDDWLETQSGNDCFIH